MKKRWLSLVILSICAVGLAVTAKLYPDSRETAPAVLYDGELYVCPSYGREEPSSALPGEVRYLGKIDKFVPADQLPKKNLCSNVKDHLGDEVYLEELQGDDAVFRRLYIGQNGTYHFYIPYLQCVNSVSGWPRIQYRGAVYRQIGPACFTLGEVKQIRTLEPADLQARRYLPLLDSHYFDFDGDFNRKFLAGLNFYEVPDDPSVLFAAEEENADAACVVFFLDRNVYDGRIRGLGDYVADLRLQWDGKLYTLTGSLTDSSIIRNRRLGWPIPDTFLGRVSGSTAIDELPEEDGRTNCRSLTGCNVYGYSNDPAHIDI